MKNAKLFVDGKEIDIIIADQLYDEITAKKVTGYERVKGGTYYYDTGYGAIEVAADVRGVKSKLNYDRANYYSNVNIANNNARADKLMRQLRRFAVERRKEDIEWTDTNKRKYYIYYDYDRGQLYVMKVFSRRDLGQIYFDTPEAAELAMETFKAELLWYFTEYRDSL